MLEKKYLIAAAAIVSGLVGVVAWAYYDGRADAARVESEIIKELTDSDLAALLKSQSDAGDGNAASITESPEARKAFVRGLKEHLSLAAEARREGLADDPTFKVNFNYKTNLLLADLYQTKLGHSLDRPYRLSEDEIRKVWADPANNAAFKLDMDTLQKIQGDTNRMLGNGMSPGIMAGETIERAKTKWARAKLLSDMARNDAGFMADRNVQLRTRILEAGILSADFVRKHFGTRIKANNTDIRKFIADNPQYDIATKRSKAENVLARVRQGEDFSKLVKEFSEHRPTRDTGGLFENVLAGDQPEDLEKALLKLAPGQVTDRLVETELGYHIARLEKKGERNTPDGRKFVEYTFRQILFQNKFEQPGIANPDIPPPFMTAEEIARMIVEKQKRDAFVAEYVSKNSVELPEDFSMPVQ